MFLLKSPNISTVAQPFFYQLLQTFAWAVLLFTFHTSTSK